MFFYCNDHLFPFHDRFVKWFVQHTTYSWILTLVIYCTRISSTLIIWIALLQFKNIVTCQFGNVFNLCHLINGVYVWRQHSYESLSTSFLNWHRFRHHSILQPDSTRLSIIRFHLCCPLTTSLSTNHYYYYYYHHHHHHHPHHHYHYWIIH